MRLEGSSKCEELTKQSGSRNNNNAAEKTNSPVDGMEYFTVFFFTAVDSGEQQRETRVIQHRSMTGGELHEGRTKSWMKSQGVFSPRGPCQT